MNNDTFAHRRAFYLLKKFRSYTWAEEIFRLTKKFAVKMEEILRKPPSEFQPVNDMDEAFMVECWNACGEMEQGLAFIGRGNKGIGYAQFRRGSGFARQVIYGSADRGSPRRYVDNDTNLTKYERIGFSESTANLGAGMFELLERAMMLGSYGWIRHHVEAINYFSWPETPSSDLRETTLDFPRWLPGPLDPVPDPILNAPVIVSGDEVPITGIWQPEPLKPLGKITLELIGGVETYCMNFLVQGNTAPNMVPEAAYVLWKKTGDGPKYGDDYPVRWRLIWRDERYGSNGIPEEEKNYLRMAAQEAAEAMPAGRLRGLPGQQVPQSGYWWTPSLQVEQDMRLFTQGDRFPEVTHTEYGEVIWYFDSQNQQG
jgi:Immunity protein 72/Immunity protein 71